MLDRVRARASPSNKRSTTAKLIHPQYLLKRVLNAAAARFAHEQNIQLQQFLLPVIAQRAVKSLQRDSLKFKSVPDQYQYHTFRPASVTKKIVELLRSQAFAHLLSFTVQKKVRLRSIVCRCYAHRDYTLLHDKNKELPGFDVLLDLTPRWDGRACGHHSYVHNGNELVRVDSAFNTLTIVRRPKNVLTFVKYANHHAGKDKRFVLEARFS